MKTLAFSVDLDVRNENQALPRRSSVVLESSLASMDIGEEMAREAAQAAGLDNEEQYRVSLAVRECLINAFQHGNRADENKHIGFMIEQDGDTLTFVVTDEGEGFNPKTVPDPRADEQLLADSGRGIFLMRTFMDEVVVSPSETGGTRVLMRKNLAVTNSATGRGPEKENPS